jgi:hypothetical protein
MTPEEEGSHGGHGGFFEGWHSATFGARFRPPISVSVPQSNSNSPSYSDFPKLRIRAPD